MRTGLITPLESTLRQAIRRFRLEGRQFRRCLPATLYTETDRPDSCTGMHLGYNTPGYIVSPA